VIRKSFRNITVNTRRFWLAKNTCHDTLVSKTILTLKISHFKAFMDISASQWINKTHLPSTKHTWTTYLFIIEKINTLQISILQNEKLHPSYFYFLIIIMLDHSACVVFTKLITSSYFGLTFGSHPAMTYSSAALVFSNDSREKSNCSIT